MKKNILLTLIGAFTFLNFYSVNGSASLIGNTSLRAPKVHVYIDFGREPKCNRMNGICNFTPINESGKTFNYPCAGCYATYEKGILQIEVLENEMSDQLIYEFNNVHLLPIDLPIELSPEITKSLMIPPDIRIQVGQYPISKIESGFMITLNLK